MIAKEELNILWSLEQTAKKYEDRVAVSDVNQELTWKGLVKKAQVIGAELSKKVQPGNPIPVLLEKSSETLAVMLGIVYAGCFYVPVNPMNPAERLRKIMEKLEPEVIISDEKGKEQLEAVGVGLEEKVIGPEILLLTTGTDLSEEQRSKLEQIQGQWKETDALYGILKYPEDLSQAVSIGNAVSALKNTVPGDFPAMDLSEIRELIQEHKANGPVMEMKR